MNIKKAYNFLYYCLFKIVDVGVFIFWSEWKALILISSLPILLLLSLFNYYISGKLEKAIQVDINNVKLLAIGIIGIIFTLNYLLFINEGQWKIIIKDFDRLPKSLKIKNSLLVILLISLLILNLVYSFYILENASSQS